MIEIIVSKQILRYYKKGVLDASYPVNTAKNGVGEQQGSYCTPRGKHKVYAKIGENLPHNAVLVGRMHTGEIYTKKLAKLHSTRDWILSRIIWLQGCEPHNKNTKDRYIYIHGMPDEQDINIPNSKGCIRMRNKDIIKLFKLIRIDDNIVIIG